MATPYTVPYTVDDIIDQLVDDNLIYHIETEKADYPYGLDLLAIRVTKKILSSYSPPDLNRTTRVAVQEWEFPAHLQELRNGSSYYRHVATLHWVVCNLVRLSFIYGPSLLLDVAVASAFCGNMLLQNAQVAATGAAKFEAQYRDAFPVDVIPPATLMVA